MRLSSLPNTAWLPPRAARLRSVGAEHLDCLVKATIPLRPAQKFHPLDHDLPGCRLLEEQGHRLVDEGIKRHVAFAGRLAGPELGLNRRRRKLDDLDLSLELFAQRHRIGMDCRLVAL